METSTDSPTDNITVTTTVDSEGTPTPRKINDVSLDAEAAMLAELDAAIASAATSEEQPDEETPDNADAAETVPGTEESSDFSDNSAEAGLVINAEDVPTPDSSDGSLDTETELPALLDTATEIIPAALSSEPGAGDEAGLSATTEEVSDPPESTNGSRPADGAMPAELDAAPEATSAAEEYRESGDDAVVDDEVDQSATPEDHHLEEVPALLGTAPVADDAEAAIMAVLDAAIADDTPPESHISEDTQEDTADTGAAFAPELPEEQPRPETASEHPAPVPAHDPGIDLQEVWADIRAISAKIDAVSVDTDSLINQVNSLSIKYDSLAEEIQAHAADGAAKSFLSKTFLTVSSVLVAALAVFQLYTFVSLIRSERKEHATVTALLGTTNDLTKKLADYDKNLIKALAVSAQTEHAPPHHAAPEQPPHGAAGKTDSPSAPVIPVLEKMNRLRNGLPEKKLIRKETGDWFVYNKKGEECIADVEVIDVLNQAYRKSGRSISPGFPLPAHNSLCLLKPDGKGGTEVVMTKNFIP